MARRRAAVIDDRTFAAGARVLVRDEEWVVRSAHQSSFGGAAVHVTGLSELVRGKAAIFLTAIDTVTLLEPEETTLVADTSAQFRRGRLYLESLLRRSPPTDASITIGHRAAMNQADYQLVPAARALQQPRARILIADAVGLGKTLEAGILLSELIRRGRGDRILVVVLKSLLSQFQKELWSRFAIPLVRLDSVGIARVQREIPGNMNPFYVYPRVIISIDTLKQNEKYRRDLEQCHWDAIVIDECQNVAARGTDSSRSLRARLAALLARTCDSLILTSATPHDGSARSFASLMNLLEPTAIADEENYNKADIEGLFVRRTKKDVAASRGVRKHFPERELTLERVPASEPEAAVFKALGELELPSLQAGRGAVLFRTTLLKALLSSTAACLQTVNNRIATLERAAAKARELFKTDPEAEGRARVTPEQREADAKALAELRTLLEACEAESSSKLAAVLKQLKELGYKNGKPGRRVVIFSERLETLAFLKEELSARLKLSVGSKKTRKSKEDERILGQIETFVGSTPDVEQGLLADDFGAEDGVIRILLASDAASEGLNLHFQCSDMIHFDIPWSLITLEQRNGRIDRFGQEQTPQIRYLLQLPSADAERGESEATAAGDLRVLDRLIAKEEEAKKNLGDAADLMKLYDASKEEEQVARAVQGEVKPEEVLPDTEDADEDFFMDLLGGGDEAGKSEEESSVETVVPFSLFADDYAWAREAMAWLADDDAPGAMGAPDVEWIEDQEGFSLAPPADLTARLDRMPRELRSRKELKLTTKRELVLRSMAASRKETGSWPDWQLFWDLHPVAEWLGDRVLAAFRRHEAPVMRVPRGLDEGEAALLFQGVLSNKRSQPMIVDWFVVLFKGEEARGTESLTDFAERTGLTGALPNPGREIPGAWLQGLREPAVELAKEHMATLRAERRRAVRKPLAISERKVKAWRKSALDRVSEIEGRQIKTLGERRARKAADRRRQEIEDRFQRRQKWIVEGLSTSDVPYLRLAAVFVTTDAS